MDTIKKCCEIISKIGVIGSMKLFKEAMVHTFNERTKIYFPPSHKIEKYKNSYVLSYEYNSHNYKILLKNSRKKRIMNVFDDTEQDVSEIILPYAGPFLDFYNLRYTPKDFGYKKLTFLFVGGQKKTFEETEEISFLEKI
jgi:hypothetical protein